MDGDNGRHLSVEGEKIPWGSIDNVYLTNGVKQMESSIDEKLMSTHLEAQPEALLNSSLTED